MLGRLFVCAIVMMGVVTPAAAGERPSYSPFPDTLRLLLQDEQATFRAATPMMLGPRFDARTRLLAPEPLAATLTAFEALTVPVIAYLPDLQGRGGLSRFALAAPQPGFTGWPIAVLTKPTGSFGALAVIDEAMASYARPPKMRGRSRLDTMLTFSLDGEETTRSLSMRGPASVLNLIPVP